MQLGGSVACIWLLVSLGFHFPAPWKLNSTCTKYMHCASCWMLLLSMFTEEVYMLAQGAKCRLGLKSHKYIGYLWGQQNQITEGSEIPELPWHPGSLLGRALGFCGHHLQQLLPLLQAIPPGLAQMLVGCVWILSYHEHNLKLCPHNEGKAQSTLGPHLTFPSWQHCIHLHPSRAEHKQWHLKAVLLKSVQCTTLFLPAYFYFLVSKIKIVVGSIDVSQHSFKKKEKKEKQNHC